MMVNCCSPPLQSCGGLEIFGGNTFCQPSHESSGLSLPPPSAPCQPRVCGVLGNEGDVARKETTCTITELGLGGNMN